MRRILHLTGCLLLAGAAAAQQGAATKLHPRDAEIHDADTRAWWHTTEALSGDAMEGRDTGSAAYQRAADYVARRFAAAGLRPAADAQSYFQHVPMHEVAMVPGGTSFTVVRPGADGMEYSPQPLPFLQEITVAASSGLPAELDAAMTFRGYCGKDAMAEIKGKIVVCFGTQRSGLTTGAQRLANVRAGGAVGLINVDDPGFAIEPPRWPYAYARSVTLVDGKAKQSTPGSELPVMRVGEAGFRKLLAGTREDADGIASMGGDQAPLPSFDLQGRLHVRLQTQTREISSPNVLAVREGSDPELKKQFVVIAAHLDGYGFGTPVDGDGLYNGTLDDAAYVALMIQFADDLKAGRVTTKRSILFAAFTGEEKGLLGSSWYVAHPTEPLVDTVADINLDQLRPLFPLKILTALAVGDTTLGATAQQVGASMEIEIRPDKEPERGLLRRADHFPFLKAGVPAIGFIFGYDPGTDAERRYREWYQVRYHRPQDDLSQPVDFGAAAKFDQYFYALVKTVADAPERPRFLAGSAFGGSSSHSSR